jgi:succinoglycan biosynthesis transport protein ExoP
MNNNLPSQVPPQLVTGPLAVDAPHRSDMSIADILGVLWRHKWFILTCAVLGFGLAFAYVRLTTPVYQATATIQIDPSRVGSLGLSELISLGSGSGSGLAQSQTELLIMQSDGVLLSAVNGLSAADQQKLLGSIPRDGLSHPDDLSPQVRSAILGTVRSALKCKNVEGTQVIQVDVRNHDPVLASRVANGIVDAYIRNNFISRYDSVNQVSKWLSGQMDDLKDRADQAQTKLAEFQQENNILGADTSDNTTIDRLKMLNNELTAAEADRIAKEARFKVAASGDPKLVASLGVDPALETLEEQKEQLFGQYAQMSSKFGPRYPPLVALASQQRKLDSEISREVSQATGRLEQDFDFANRTEGMLRNQYQGQVKSAFALNKTVAQYVLLHDEEQSSRDLYDMLQYKLQQADIDAGLGSVNTTIVDRARVPAFPAEPKEGLSLTLGLCVGLVGGITGSFLRESLNDSLESIDQVEQLTSLPILATIPRLKENELTSSSGPKDSDGLSSRTLVTVRQPLSRYAEAYRMLRSSVLLASLDRKPKTFLVTSSLPGEGKTTVALNFGFVLAQRGAHVLLVDTDLRRPALHQRLRISNDKGLSSWLLGEETSGAVFTPLSSHPSLEVIPSGPKIASPAEALGSNRFRELLEQWERQYDFIVLDSAPVLSVSDAFPAASWVDSVLMIARYGTTPARALVRSITALRRANARISGVVLNAMPHRAEEYYYYTGYSGKYYED